jgi:hypothetical protein
MSSYILHLDLRATALACAFPTTFPNCFISSLIPPLLPSFPPPPLLHTRFRLFFPHEPLGTKYKFYLLLPNPIYIYIYNNNPDKHESSESGTFISDYQLKPNQLYNESSLNMKLRVGSGWVGRWSNATTTFGYELVSVEQTQWGKLFELGGWGWLVRGESSPISLQLSIMAKPCDLLSHGVKDFSVIAFPLSIVS